MRRELEALGVEKRMRGPISNETLRVLRHLFTNQAAAYDGDLVSFPPFVFEPQPRCPPIWIGGNGDPAIARVLEFGDGWHPMLPAQKLKPAVIALKEKLRASGRNEIEIVVRRGLRFDDIAAARERVAIERDAGATYYILDLGRYPSEREFTAQAETFMSKVAS
jgi:alkanesulfonate monooxygenase SsuD/methylene tetrahydromethanopterin reductase-like flavin-dependent oxidoreductase (luciferase family)